MWDISFQSSKKIVNTWKKIVGLISQWVFKWYLWNLPCLLSIRRASKWCLLQSFIYQISWDICLKTSKKIVLCLLWVFISSLLFNEYHLCLLCLCYSKCTIRYWYFKSFIGIIMKYWLYKFQKNRWHLEKIFQKIFWIVLCHLMG